MMPQKENKLFAYHLIPFCLYVFLSVRLDKNRSRIPCLARSGLANQFDSDSDPFILSEQQQLYVCAELNLAI